MSEVAGGGGLLELTRVELPGIDVVAVHHLPTWPSAPSERVTLPDEYPRSNSQAR
jgi:hypothetical protein